MRVRLHPSGLFVCVFALLLAGVAFAVQQPAPRPADELLFQKPELQLRTGYQRASALATLGQNAQLAELGVSAENTMVDRLTGRFATLMPSTPLFPGRGQGNRLAWSGAPPASAIELEQVAGQAFRSYVDAHQAALRISSAELAWPGKVGALSDEQVSIYIPRQIGGILVRDSSLSATIKFGNLMLLGAENWADFDGVLEPSVSAEEAEAVVREYAEGRFGAPVKGPFLNYVPARVVDAAGERITYRLAWVIGNDLGEPGAHYEALVDATSGELLSLQDKIQWVAAPRRAQGGVYPVGNDQLPPDGVEQAGWPMPFSSITAGAANYLTDIGGNTPLCLDGNATAVLAGPYLNMADVCGAESLTAATDILDWGSGPAAASTDCTTPGFGGAGNTKASRTGFHELGMIQAMGRSHLPSNSWLQQQLTANMNVVATCNANWTGTVVNFFRSGGGCRNTGEIAGIFDHEWGHGMDNNGVNPNIANPGEGIADIYANLRLNDSCIGRGFRQTGVCGGYGDPCINNCSGVRDTDYANRQSGQPHDILWINLNCGSGPAPCGGGVHCEGSVYAEAVWDLWNRHLTAAPYTYDLDQSREIAARMTYVGASPVTSWFTCADLTAPVYDNGCGATNGYLQYLAADDDNANLADGTPHMGAIFAAFDAHKIACSIPAVTDGGCAGAPTAATSVTAAPVDKGVNLSWTAVPSATEYEVFRTDGVFGCNFGKLKIGSTTGLTFEDRGLQNGRSYSYQVIAKGASDSCFGPASVCQTVAPGGAGAAATVLASNAQVNHFGGDGDPFLDNCEIVRVNVPVANTGTTTLTNVEVVTATSPSHPGTTVVDALPSTVSASLASCATAVAQIDLRPQGLASGDTMTVELEIDATELTSPQTILVTVQRETEGDFQATPTQTWSFAAGTESWNTTAGTFVRTNVAPVPPDGNFYFQSSANLPDQCDVVESPVVRLTSTSTLSMQVNYDTEPFSTQWYDRANVGFRNASTNVRTVVSPSSGNAYSASGVGGTCGTDSQPGWAGNSGAWVATNWTSAALQTGTLANQAGRLEIRYGTDAGDHRAGFRFDGVTLTNFDIAVADGQSNSCVATNVIFVDGFEVGSATKWSSTAP